MTVSIHVECLGDTRHTLGGIEADLAVVVNGRANEIQGGFVLLVQPDRAAATLIPKEQIRWIRVEEE